MEEDIDLSKEEMDKIESIFEKANKRYREENSCPECGSHNVDFDILYISGPRSGWIEWCNDCGWEKETKT